MSEPIFDYLRAMKRRGIHASKESSKRLCQKYIESCFRKEINSTSRGFLEWLGIHENLFPGTILIENARFISRNFSGTEGVFNRQGCRNFVIELDPYIVECIGTRKPTITVHVPFKMEYMSPKITIEIDGRKRAIKDEHELQFLDFVDLESARLVLTSYDWNINGYKSLCLYLKEMSTKIIGDELGSKF